MEHRLIKDPDGNTPNYVVESGKLIHQPTKKWVVLSGDLKECHRRLKALVDDRD